MGRKERDTQRSRVYAWGKELHTLDTWGSVKLDDAQMLVNHIWSNAGLEHPPVVKPIAAQTRRWAGRANRFEIHLLSRVDHVTLIHEIVHSMTLDVDDNEPEGGAHGPIFAGLFMKLLSEHMKVPLFTLMHMANKHGVKFDLTAEPVMKE